MAALRVQDITGGMKDFVLNGQQNGRLRLDAKDCFPNGEVDVILLEAGPQTQTLKVVHRAA